jgi:pyruvate formate lyase activating enzyme
MAEITIQLNDEGLKVPSGITVKKAFQLSGYKVTKFPEKEALFVPCEVGGCWSCAVLIDEEPKQHIITGKTPAT